MSDRVQQRFKMETGLSKRRLRSFLSVEDADDADDVAVRVSVDALNGEDGRATGGGHVFNDDNVAAGFKGGPLDARWIVGLPSSPTFGRLANHETP